MNKSQEWTERLHKVIPWGSSTCSKAPHLDPEEPGAIVRGKGCRVWDADGREFIDYRFGLGPVNCLLDNWPFKKLYKNKFNDLIEVHA